MKIINLSASLEEKLIFKDISISINPGELHIIMGSNGSGKSSLAATLMGHPAYSVIQGAIELDGENIAELAPDKRAHRGLYLAMQYPPTLPGISVLTFLREAYQALKYPQLEVALFTKLVEDALVTVGLPEYFAQRALHDGFSGGEKKRLELAQILVLKPTTIILDEIDSGLDAAGIVCVEQIIKKIRAERPGTRIICITHNQAFAHTLNPNYVHTMSNGTLRYDSSGITQGERA